MDANNQIAQWLAATEYQPPLLLVTDAAPSITTFIPEATLKIIEYIQVPADDKLQVQHVRELLERIQTRALTGMRLVWIPDAHRLLPAAANALLKTLEDTSRTNRFLLTTPYPGRLLTTIRSRTRILRMPRSRTEYANKPIPTFDPKRKTALSGQEAAAIAENLHQRITDGSATATTTRTLMRLRDYYKAASQGVGQRAASDALLASLEDDVY